MILRLIAVAMVLMTASAARAELVFTHTEQRIEGTPGESETRARFAFENRGRKPVQILQVTTSCGCTVVEPAKTTIAPGERGELEARYIFGTRLGEQVSTITVLTDGREPRSVLTLRVNIPKFATLTPRMLWWGRGDKAVKVAELEVQREEPVKIEKVEASHASLRWTVKTIEEGRRYYVEVEPPAAEAGSLEYLTITLDQPKDKPVTWKILIKKVER